MLTERIYVMHESEPTLLHPQLDYRAEVLDRVSHSPTETTRWGARIHSELVTLQGTDGRQVIRELTIAEPSARQEVVSPYSIVETDPWTTGERGFNRDKIRSYTKLGYSVLWLHHGGRHSPVAKDKSVSRGAHQMHAVLDDLTLHNGLSTNEVIVAGYSRGGMTADKFIALGSVYNRSTVFSNTEAPCFARDMTAKEKVTTLARQTPGEIIGIGKVAAKLVLRAIEENDPWLLAEYVQTLDVHPRNLIQEALWAHALINASVGYSTDSMPKDTIGIRNLFTKDYMSQLSEYRSRYAAFPNLRVREWNGPHLYGATPEYQRVKNNDFKQLLIAMQQNNMSLSGVRIDDVLVPAA